MTKRCML